MVDRKCYHQKWPCNGFVDSSLKTADPITEAVDVQEMLNPENGGWKAQVCRIGQIKQRNVPYGVCHAVQPLVRAQ